MAAGDINFSGAISLTSYMTTNLNSLADETTNIGGTVLDNTSSEHTNFVAELYLGSVDLSAETNPAVELYLVPSGDGTNYADDGTDASTTDYPAVSYLAGVFAIQATSAVHRAVIVMQDYLLNLKYTPVLINKTGVAFAASGNTLKIGTNSRAVAQS